MVNPKKRPILFSGPMVRAVREGRKTQTRRLVKPQPAPNAPHDGGTTWVFDAKKGLHVPYGTVGHLTVAEKGGLRCPYGLPGDRLWVRETWAMEDAGLDGKRVIWQADRGAAWVQSSHRLGETFWLASDYTPSRWRPSIHMPRWASRLTLEVTAVRVERLQDISEEDARAEGFSPGTEELLGGAVASMSAADYFRTTWWDLYGFESWDANPWVWVVEFRRCPATG